MTRILPLALAPLALLAGCATLSQPMPATTLADVELSWTLSTQAADTYVTQTHPSAAVLAQIQTARAQLAAAVHALESGYANGQPLDLTAFNAALSVLSNLGVKTVAPAHTGD